MYFVCVCAYMSRLEVNLQKRSEGPLWAELVLGDKRGQYVVDEEQAAQLHQKLAYLTAEELVCHCSYFLLLSHSDHSTPNSHLFQIKASSACYRFKYN